MIRFLEESTQFGDFFHDMVLHLRLGQVAADDADDATRFVRYIDNPGQKAVKKVKFTVNGNPLDEYDSEVHNMHNKFNFEINNLEKDLV